MEIFFKYLEKIIKNKYEYFINIIKNKYEKIEAYVDDDGTIDTSKIVYEDLAPKDNIDKDGVYAKALDWALGNDNILNIALTGPYGSGKSSILRTYKKKRPNNTYLNVSLASFRKDGTDYKDKNNKEYSKNNTLDEIEIEKSILQQLFYRVKSEKIPYSRFGKIKNLKSKELIKKIGFIVITSIVGIVIFFPNTINIVKSNASILTSFKFSNNLIIILYIIFFIFSFKILIDILKYFNKGLKLSKINLQKAEIELEKSNDESIFNRYLDEILYFFEVTKYNVLFIEDLDRFDDVNIFTKLRELNSLINNSQQINKKVVFIYAIKDEMFTNKNRTKFFDFIIPVIPVINASNSGELLFKKIKKDKLDKSICEKFINDITIYIDDMRILNNIYNEFIIYKQTLSDVSLNLKNLLSIIVYKNIYPDDFAKLQFNEGIVYQAFEKKNKVISEESRNIKEKYLKLEEKLKFIEKEHLNSIKELNGAFLLELCQGETDFTNIIVNNESYNFSDILEDSFDISVFYDQTINVQYRYSSNINITMKEIDDKLGNEKSFLERVKIIKLKNKSSKEDIKQEISALRRKETLIKSWSLSKTIQKVGVESIFEETTIKQKKLIIFLLRHGYIDEMYQIYITYFYPGSLTKNDMNFIMSIKDQEALEPTYELKKIDKIIDRLNINEFERNEVLNYNLVEFILENNIKYQEYFKVILEQLSNELYSSITFIDSFKNITMHKELFIKSLCNNWSNIWFYIENKSNFPLLKKDEYLKDIIVLGDIEDITKINKENILTKYISGKFDLINLMSEENGTEKIKKIIKNLGVKFKNVDSVSEDNELLEFIFENNLYEINKTMIESIIQQKDANSLQNIYRRNYTIIKQINYAPLYMYINENLNQYIEDVFLKLENNDIETEEAVIELLNNEQLNKKLKHKIIDKEGVNISNITSINKELWSKVISSFKIEISWFNLINYYDFVREIDEVVISFLNKENNCDILSKEKLNKNNNFEDELYEEFSENIILSKKISENVFLKLSQSIPYSYDEFDASSLSGYRVCSMINCKLLDFTLKNYNNLRQTHKDKLILFIERNIDVYVEEQNIYEVDSNDIFNILNSKTVTIEQKVIVINKMDKGIVDDDLNLSKLICDILLKCTGNIRINKQLLENIFENPFPETKKIRLLTKQINYLDNQSITDYLIMVGKQYENITATGKRPLIDDSDINRELLRQLIANGYISSFREDKHKLRVQTKLR